MIIKIQFLNSKTGETFTMMFGNSYKKWREQVDEYMRMSRARNEQIEPIKMWKSLSKWIAWGGLKWCNENDFQKELNREGVQMDEPDNKNPRKYSEMVFIELD